MLNTFRGTVESDPMRIPAPSRSQGSNERSFASELDRVSTEAPTAEPQPEPAPPADIDDELAATAPEQPVERQAGDDDATDGTSAVADEGDLAEGAARQGTQPATADATEIQRRGEPGRQKTAGKGTDSPRTSNPQLGSGDALTREFAALSDRAVQVRAGVVPPATTPSSPATTTAGEPLLRGVDAAGPKTDGAAPRAVRPGYTTSAKVSAELIEHARDSIFKQILLKITGDGGEMRLRLDPPELGELELRMTVENGNRVSLTIATERGDLADLIGRHVAELAETFAGAGLELTHADVQARDAGAGSAADDGRIDSHGGDDAADDDIRGPRSGGYIRADGLDFWV